MPSKRTTYFILAIFAGLVIGLAFGWCARGSIWAARRRAMGAGRALAKALRLALAAASLVAMPAAAADKSECIAPAKPGGGFDLTCKLAQSGLKDSGLLEAPMRVTYMPGGASLLATMKANGAHAALVSGGFTAFTQSVATELGFDENRANTLLVEDAKLTGDVGRPILGKAAKVQALEEITTRIGIGVDEVIAVGDGANDLGMLHAAGTGAALHAKPSVAAECDVRINHGDLTALLFLQGYAKTEFVN